MAGSPTRRATTHNTRHKKRTASTPHASQKYSLKQLTVALTESRGMIAIAARGLGCERKTIYNALARYPQLKEVLATEREFSLDSAEMKLFEAVDRAEAWAVCFYLKTQGRARGYIEKQDIGLDAVTLEQLVLLSQAPQGKTP